VPVDAEYTLTDLDVTGTIPEHLDGRYLRNGPNPIGEVDSDLYHWFVGDGMVHGIRIRHGRVVPQPLGAWAAGGKGVGGEGAGR
jgi:carotenoid cleavage oxygenase